MIRRSVKRKLISEINITPFTDVILVLLIIFMITTPLIIQSGIRVNLPGASSVGPLKNTRSQADISVTSEGTIYMDGRLVTKKELRRELDAMHNSNPGLEVILFSDKMVRFKDIVAIFDVLNELGLRNLNVMAGPE